MGWSLLKTRFCTLFTPIMFYGMRCGCEGVKQRNMSPWHHGYWSTLVQVIAWHLFGAKLLPETMLTYCQAHPNKTWWNLIKIQYFNQNTMIFSKETPVEKVACKMATIWLMPQPHTCDSFPKLICFHIYSRSDYRTATNHGTIMLPC